MTKNSVCYDTFLRNDASYDCHLWCTSAVRWAKRQKLTQNHKKILCVAPYILGTIYHIILIFGTQVEKDNTSRHCFIFKESFIFAIIKG